MEQFFNQTQQMDANIQTLKPNIKKIVLSNMTTVLGGVILFIVILVILQFSVGLDTFTDLFKMFGIEVNLFLVGVYIGIGIVILVIGLILGNLITVGKVDYEVHQNKFVMKKNVLMILSDVKEIPYENISRISFNNDGIFNTLFQSGTITFELTGMKYKEATMEFIDNTEQTVNYLQQVIRNYLAAKQAEYSENYRISNILDSSI